MSQGILGDLSRRYGKLRPSPRDFFFALELEKKAILNELRSGFLFRTQKIFFLNQVGLIQELLQFGILVSSVEFLFLESPNFTVQF